MRNVQAAWLLAVGLSGLLQACGGESDRAPSEVVVEAQEGLGHEDPSPGPVGAPAGGAEQGGPGNGWSGGWAGDPQYAPYVGQYPQPRDPHRDARQRENERIYEENHRNDGRRDYYDIHRFYNGGDSIPAPPAPRWLFGPLPCNEKARCIERCWQKHVDDDEYCRRLPKELRQACWIKSIRDYGECVRECSRKFPFYPDET
jgi:hypothetical protein